MRSLQLKFLNLYSLWVANNLDCGHDKSTPRPGGSRYATSSTESHKQWLAASWRDHVSMSEIEFCFTQGKWKVYIGHRLELIKFVGYCSSLRYMQEKVLAFINTSFQISSSLPSNQWRETLESFSIFRRFVWITFKSWGIDLSLRRLVSQTFHSTSRARDSLG